jgi:hypothetical protein
LLSDLYFLLAKVASFVAMLVAEHLEFHLGQKVTGSSEVGFKQIAAAASFDMK